MRTGPLLATAALLLALAGCVPTGPAGIPTPTAHATPVFASDAEALAAAEKAYAAYLAVSAKITGDGGANPERIDSYVTTEQAPREHETYAYFSTKRLHTVGSPTFSAPKLEQLRFDNTGAAELTFYTCVDASQVRILNTSNADVTPANRDNQAPLEVTLVSSGAGRPGLLLSESTNWSGPGVCS